MPPTGQASCAINKSILAGHFCSITSNRTHTKLKAIVSGN
ncbi:hypothetical protein APS_2717 [Acetobacter pasteurianus subsp. pasteurianus LMG 1262 = NBRC 106471]|nr:hypothetical protein APS_2717 [Acetobacter pasteurianus subsp. pasteurianus LMG 1262 = NBRC 106471]